MKSLDFTTNKYKELCLSIIDSGYKICTVKDYLADLPGSGPYALILKHDVDRMPENALKMALLEKELGILSSYYFRAGSGVFKKSKDASIQIWVTADENRIPLRLKSKVVVGNFIGELISADGVDLGTALAESFDNP